MGTLDEDFNFVAASVRRAAAVQRAESQAVLDDPEARSPALARHLLLTYDAVLKRLDERIHDYGSALDNEVRRDAALEMRRMVWDIRKLQSNLTWLGAAQAPPLDLGTTYFVEATARTLVADDVEVTLVAMDYPSYATSSDPWGPLISAWGSGIPVDEPTVVVVLIPRRERHSGLLHPLIVHELGHAADNAHGVVTKIWHSALGRKRFPARFSTASAAFARAQNISPADAVDLLGRRLRFWLAEATCDCLAAQLLGPTYLYSFLAEVAAGSMDEAAPKHPPPRQRVRLLFEQLERLGWQSALHAADPSLYAWLQHVVSEKPSYSGPDEFLLWAVNDLRAVVRREVRRLVGANVFQPNPNELAEVAALLAAGVPPAQRQTGDAVSAASIILESWHAALRATGKTGPEALPAAADAPILADVLPAALELAALSAAWDDV